MTQKNKEKNWVQNKYFNTIRKCDLYEVNLGRLIKTSDGYRQKGVDILITLDMITKAFLNHYEIGFLLAGDDDFLDLVQNIKRFSKHSSEKRIEIV